MKTTAIKVEGQIISPEIFDNLDSGEIKGQSPKDYGFDSKVKVKEEIQRAWANAKDQWKIFKRYIEPLTEEESGTSETRRYWIIPLLSFLGYNVTVSRAEIVNENSYAISHRDMNIDGFPIHIVSFNDSLDRKRESSGPRLSPHALVQEYLNLTEHIYGFVTNGYKLRLLRDSGKLVRLTFVEFDLQKMMEEDLYAEFSILYRLLHITRMPQKMSEGDISLIEQYHQDSLEAGARIREKLSGAVEDSIKVLGNGFLSNPKNQELIELIKSGQLSANGFYHHLLRLVYRILFLMVLEERDIVYPNDDGDGNTKYYKDLYYEFYSLQRLRRLSEKIFFFDEKLFDLWISLRNTFKIFGSENLAAKIKLYPLDGDLFDYGSLGVLSDSDIDNRTLLQCIKNLSQFDDKDTKSIIRVNYSALNVEEFGSVYEGLLEKAPTINFDGQHYSFSFIEGTERSSSGSHYTPEELVQPLIKHSLDYVIEDKLKAVIARSGATKQSAEEIKKEKEKALLSTKVCDVACGSGHILLSAARRIAQELTKVRTGEDQPSPEPYRHAIRDVINHCIYGVDKNPLAVELCKVALWLEAHNPGMPLNFLDHKIKCGDSIVGLARIEELQNGIATEAFKSLPDDDKEIAAAYRKQNKSESENRAQLKLTDTEEIIKKLDTLSTKFKIFNQLPDTTLDEVKRKREELEELKKSEWRLKELADIQVAQFFIDKTNANKGFLITDAEYFRIFAGQKKEVNTRKISQAMAVAAELRFFHWFLEFPEVMQEGGFDCILGNPPFRGGLFITNDYGADYTNYIKTSTSNAGATTDLVAYFFRRTFLLINDKRFISLIGTNSISEGDTRETGLEYINETNGSIVMAVSSIKWPGVANLHVSLCSIFKGKWSKPKYLNFKEVTNIDSWLSLENKSIKPNTLKQPILASLGTTVYGKGFFLENKEAMNLINSNQNLSQLIKPFLNGDDVLTNPKVEPSRKVFYFQKLSEEQLQNYPEIYQIAKERIFPERQESGSKRRREKWWLYTSPAEQIYESIHNLNYVLVTCFTSKYILFVKTSIDMIFSNATIVISTDKNKYFCILQSFSHEIWVKEFSSTLETRQRYAVSDCFDTFPFPQILTKETEAELEKIGEEYHEFRRQLMLDMQLGLTKTYNLFHNAECRIDNVELAKEIREFKSANLQIPIEEAIQRIEKLRALHKQMDEAVLKAYGWTDVDLNHAFYEVDYLPENDRVRYTISPDARKEILKRLLELNHKIHTEEVAKGLWDKKVKKTKGKSSKVKEPGINYNQEEMF
ncbi:MAG: hypothetical protein BroJett017_27130 [Ignavibacteriota bacterium]|nr:MAG: hypothetical protein BroJett017_27130 [Ignavibacteriota bacterium]